MDIRKLQRAIVDGLEDVKAQDIVVFNTEHLSPLFERVIIASGTSNRQTRALAASVRDAVKSRGFVTPRVEGQDNGEWIIVDCAAAVVHIMQPAIRQYYQLEEIWGEKPVALKLKTAKAGLAKASEPEDEDDAPVKATKAKKAGGKTAATPPARKSVAAKKAPAAKKAVAKKGPAKKVAAKKAVAKKAATTSTLKKVVVNAPVAKKAAAKKVAAKKVAVKKVAAKKAPAVKKVAAKKVAGKKAAAKKTAR
jgi:ribosome-associated protein